VLLIVCQMHSIQGIIAGTNRRILALVFI